MANPWDNDPVLDQPWSGDEPVTVRDQYMKRLEGMTHEQIVEEYRKTKPGDRWGDFLGKVLEEQRVGETAAERDKRIGKGSVTDHNKLTSGLAGFADVGNYGFYDEGAAALDWLLGRGTYKQALANRRQQQAELRDANPKSYTAGQVAGAVPIAAQTALAMPEMAGAGLATKSLVAGVEGLGQGAVYGAGSGEGWEDRAKQALEQGLIGLGIGAAGPVVAKGVGAGYRYAADAIRNSSSAQKAVQSVWQMLQDNNITLDQARAAISKIGKYATLGDISDGMQVEAAGTAAADTAAATKMGPRYEARNQGMPARVSGYLDEVTGPFKDPQTIADSVNATKKSTGATYRSAEQYLVNTEEAVDTIRQLQKTYGPKSDTGQALKKYLDQLVDDAGNIIGEGNKVHGVRQEIDAALRRGNLPNSAPFKALRDELDKALKTGIPNFAEADKTWRGAQKVQEAFDWGQNDVMTKKTFPGQFNKKWAEMNDLEKEAALMGTRADLEMSTVSGQPNPGLKLDRKLSQNMNDQKVGVMFNEKKPGSYAKVKNRLEGEQTMAETNNLVQATRGSRTAPVSQAANKRWGTQFEALDGIVQAAGNVATAGAAGGIPGVIGSIAAQGSSALGRGILARLKQVNPETIRYAADLLSRQGDDARGAIREIIKLLRSQGKSLKEAEAIAAAISAAGRGSAPAGAVLIGGEGTR